ncbi:molybdopterin cofactor-binding domain-containing protein [Nocardioides sp. B-3]|uniref:molybdopterin cofactor-binding domain-containing protein n=1 Tax=Nocardioides sp. B-3 TaxID=2895565 RepID=UPI002152D982|nr:molybdopterin cofactor-binding domain-containing protein [Nocardioides sp. B-3]UUZ61548.1 molybdopterin-dependent oxidoreductase [Nocardioides sp. B-3]
MVCRAPTLNGTATGIRNEAAVKAMPGVTHVALLDFGVAVRARTFGQCIDAVRALDVVWAPGPVAGESDATIPGKVRAAQLPMPALPTNPLIQTVTGDFVFYFRSNSPMDTNSAIADVRADSATVWAGLKSPIVAQQRIAEALGMAEGRVKVNVVTAGGSFRPPAVLRRGARGGPHLAGDGPAGQAHVAPRRRRPRRSRPPARHLPGAGDLSRWRGADLQPVADLRGDRLPPRPR